MPFRDDRRLGGPRNNEVTLNGTHEGGSVVPEYGTVIRSETGVLYGPSVATIQGFGNTSLFEWSGQICDVNVIADGLGGEVYDWNSATNIEYTPAGTIIGTDAEFQDYPDEFFYYYDFVGGGIDDRFYPRKAKKRYFHDGTGIWYSEWVDLEYYPNGTLIVGVQFLEKVAMPPSGLCTDEWGNQVDCNYITGRASNYVWNGMGGFTAGPLSGSYFPNGTVYYTDNTPDTDAQFYIPELGATVNGGPYFRTRYMWNGLGGLGQVTSEQVNVFHPSGTFIGDDGTNNYYHNGYGGYYTEPINPE
jgi:hypothetical protein